MSFWSVKIMTVPYQFDLLNPRRKLQIQILIGLWAIAALYFLIWWFRPPHFTDLAHFAFNSFIVLWNIVLPGYYFYFLGRMKKPNPVTPISSIGELKPVKRKTERKPSAPNRTRNPR